jgi:UDP-GlcNAc:undecaprenyl-phosphate/decaprenyl-phosphate GlcNAc-1-phosphate transferase
LQINRLLMTEHLLLFLSFSLSFTIVFFAIPKIILVSNKKQLFDVPNHRKANQHKVIPNLGGIAIFSAIFIATLVALQGFDVNKISGILLAALIMFLMGLKDDTIGLSPNKKLTGQIIVTIYLIVVCNIRFYNLHGLFGINEINYSLSLIISLITILGLINAFNLIDGIDGLAAGIGIIISLTYGFSFLYFGQIEYAILSFSLTGSLIAFFFYNVFGKKNKIFMGDTGSLTLGIIFAVLTILFNEITPTKHIYNLVLASPAISLSIMIVPVVDTIRVFYVRISQKRSPFSADMNHIHHHLIRITKNHLHATIILVSINSFFIFLSFGFIEILGNSYMFLLILTLGFLSAYIPVLINRNRDIEAKTIKNIPAKSKLNTPLIKHKNPILFGSRTSEMDVNTEQSKEENSIFEKIQTN